MGSILTSTIKGVIMPIIDISGLTPKETEVKKIIRKGLKKLLSEKLSFPEDSVSVTFITDDTVGKEEAVIARLYSKKFMRMKQDDLDEICDDVVTVLEVAEHPYYEAFPVPVMAMRGRANRKQTI